jgi:t-SNARE complex subunit (syntaxin)
MYLEEDRKTISAKRVMREGRNRMQELRKVEKKMKRRSETGTGN